MRLPAIRGVIDRRILVNYHIDADVMADVLPSPFRPKLVDGVAIGGICLIRLTGMRPRFFPFPCGLRSENAAHRISVEWDGADGELNEGVYIPRRETNSRIASLAGGRLFPGVHSYSKFIVEETADRFSVTVGNNVAGNGAVGKQDSDGMRIRVVGTVTDRLPESSRFSSVAEVSEFFERGALGYSATSTDGRFEGIEFGCHNWRVEPLAIEDIESSYFEDESLFPAGTVGFDCALLMRDIPHEWHGRDDLCCPSLRS